MQPRVDVNSVNPDLYKAMIGLETYLRESSIDTGLLQLIKLRVSQVNGCAFCIDMHWKDLRAAGETEQRLYSLDAWRVSPFYTERERSALAWAEAVTNLSDGHVRDDVYNYACRHFNSWELADLTLAVVAINGWNRFSIAFRTVPGSYHPRQSTEAAVPANLP